MVGGIARAGVGLGAEVAVGVVPAVGVAEVPTVGVAEIPAAGVGTAATGARLLTEARATTTAVSPKMTTAAARRILAQCFCHLLERVFASPPLNLLNVGIFCDNLLTIGILLVSQPFKLIGLGFLCIMSPFLLSLK